MGFIGEERKRTISLQAHTEERPGEDLVKSQPSTNQEESSPQELNQLAP